jgi:O-antigen ligase
VFVFTIPFEAAELSFTTSSFSLSKMTGMLFFAGYFFHYNPLLGQIISPGRSLPVPPRAFWWFLGYLATYILSGFFLPEKLTSVFVSRLFTLVQLFLLFWVAAALLQDATLTRQFLLSYAMASALLAAGMLLHLPGFSESVQAGGVERGTVLGNNPNTVATVWALAIIMLAGLCLNAAYSYLTRLCIAGLSVPLLAGIVSTGSRAGVGALLIGFLVYLVPHWRAKRKVVTIFLALLGIAATAYFVMNSPAAQRWQETFNEGKLAGRERIVPAALEMVAERPMFGWQPVRFQYELERRLSGSYHTGSKDAHNLLLHLLLEVGMVGTVPFLVGLWWCGYRAWKACTGDLGLLSLALFFAALAASMTHTDLARKPFWLVLALTSAAASMGSMTRPRMLLIRQPSGRDE